MIHGLALYARQSGKVIGYERTAARQLEDACHRARAIGEGVAVVDMGNATAVYVLPEVEQDTIAHFPSMEAFEQFRLSKNTTH